MPSQPLQGSQKQRLLSGTAQAGGLDITFPNMPKGGAIDTSPAKTDGPLQRPIHLCMLVISVREHTNVFRRAARVIVNFQSRGFPSAGHAVMNGIVAQAVDNHVGAAIVPGVFALAGGYVHQSFTAINNNDCAALLLIPPAESDHLVVGGPVGKRIIAGVENQNSATVPDIVFKSNLDFTRPGRAAA